MSKISIAQLFNIVVPLEAWIRLINIRLQKYDFTRAAVITSKYDRTYVTILIIKYCLTSSAYQLTLHSFFGLQLLNKISETWRILRDLKCLKSIHISFPLTYSDTMLNNSSLWQCFCVLRRQHDSIAWHAYDVINLITY